MAHWPFSTVFHWSIPSANLSVRRGLPFSTSLLYTLILVKFILQGFYKVKKYGFDVQATQSNLWIQCNVYQIPLHFYRNRKTHLKIHMESHGTPGDFFKITNLEDSHFLISKQIYINQNNMVLAYRQVYRSMGQNTEPQNKLSLYNQMIFDQSGKIPQRGSLHIPHKHFPKIIYKWPISI